MNSNEIFEFGVKGSICIGPEEILRGYYNFDKIESLYKKSYFDNGPLPWENWNHGWVQAPPPPWP